METSVRDFGDTVLTSLTTALTLVLAAIPRVIGFLIILAVGWAVASLVARGFEALLRAVKFDQFAHRSGFTDLTRNIGIRSESSALLALIAKWFVRLITLVVAFDVLGVPAVSDVLRQLLLWVPNLAVAVVILVISAGVAKALGGMVRAAVARAGITRPNVLASIVRGAVLTFGVLIALNQVGVASSLINILFMAIVGAAALALGLSFGLGGRDAAARIVGGWYESAQRAMPALADQIDEAYSRKQLEPQFVQPPLVQPPGTWTGVERRRGTDPRYQGIERRRGLA